VEGDVITPIVTQRFNKLAGTLAELKVKVRTALATKLASAVGIAVRDILVVAMIDKMIAPPTRPATRTPPSHAGWRDDEGERDRWGEPKDPWADPDEDELDRDRTHSRSEYSERDEEVPTPPVPTPAAIASVWTSVDGGWHAGARLFPQSASACWPRPWVWRADRLHAPPSPSSLPRPMF